MDRPRIEKLHALHLADLDTVELNGRVCDQPGHRVCCAKLKRDVMD
jgi:hypothetical protein